MALKCKHCALVFNRPWSHQRHRVTTAGTISPMRCLTDDEMTSQGFVLRDGKWRTSFYASRTGHRGARDARLLLSGRRANQAIRRLAA